MAPNAVQAPTVAIASPPRSQPNQFWAAANSLRLMPAWNATWPMNTNSGITVRP